jgi:cytochrome P450
MTDLLTRPASASPSPKDLKEIPNIPMRHVAAPALNSLRFVADPMVYMQKIRARYGEIAHMDGAIFKYTFAFTPEMTRQILTDTTLFYNGGPDEQPVKVPENSAMRRLSQTLNTINSDRHKTQRRLMMPAFHKKRVDAYHDEMASLTLKKIAEWQPGATCDILREMKKLTMSIAVKTLLGLDPDNEGEETRRLLEDWLRSSTSPLALLLPYDVPGLPYHRQLALSGAVEKQFQKLIQIKRANGADGNDVLSMLIEAHDEGGTRLNDEELVAETLALFIAGHETTATALAWTFFLLAQHPRIMCDLLDELEGTLRGAVPTLEQLNKLPLLGRVLDESLRILNPFVFGMRHAQADTALGDYFVPKGRTVVFAPGHIHHDPNIYSEPNRFRPQRWETLKPTPYEFLPFSAGPRMCIGATFAIMEMKLVLATVLQRFRLSLVPNAKIDRTPFILNAPRPGMPMTIHRQDRNFVSEGVRGSILKVVRLE